MDDIDISLGFPKNWFSLIIYFYCKRVDEDEKMAAKSFWTEIYKGVQEVFESLKVANKTEPN